MRSLRLWLLASALLLPGCTGDRGRFPFENTRLPVEKRADDLQDRLNPAESEAVLKGDSVTRFRVPELRPFEPRFNARALAATWDTDLAMRFAQQMADRSLAAGHRLLLSPDPRAYSADPWLASRMAVAWVSGVQGEGAIAALPGFDGVYPAYSAAIEEAGLWAVGLGAEDRADLLRVLESDMGFKGFVLGGNDVGRRLRAMIGVGMFDPPAPPATAAPDVSARVRDESIVLRRNEVEILPLSPMLASIAVIGRRLTPMPPQATYAPGKSIPEAVELARRSVAAVVFSDDAELIRAVAGSNRNTVAVFDRDDVPKDLAPAELISWGSNEIGHVLFGEESPSAGGLSYTSFAYSDLRVFPASPRYGQIVQVAVQVKNTGARSGADVVRVLVNGELRAFRRVELKPGENTEASLELDRRAMAGGTGDYSVTVGSLRGAFHLYP